MSPSTPTKHDEVLGSSFRDPSGFLFRREGRLYRQVNEVYRRDYDRLMASGLYETLQQAGHLVSHAEVDVDPPMPKQAFRVIEPTPVPFVSYPYEWCFGQLKAAALLTLGLQKTAMGFGMGLKDASAYNVQFWGYRPVLIDTLSFERYEPGMPWVAYRQFCQHFLAPLALMSFVDVRLGGLLRVHLDGVPLDLASRLLPARTRLKLGLLLHLHAHATSQRRYAGKAVRPGSARMSELALRGLIDSLESTVRGLRWRPEGTEWADYYDKLSYTSAALDHKRELVAQLLDRLHPAPTQVWDLGANTGLFSRVVSDRGIFTVAADLDCAAVERNFQSVTANRETNLLPLVFDLTNPSPSLGWAGRERLSLVERGPADLTIALALIHHLAIGNNVPFDRVASCFAQLGRSLIAEFVPKDDPQVQRLLATRKDIFGDYTQARFEEEFARHFSIVEKHAIRESERHLYLMRRHSP